jgi:putative endonuclease
MMFTVYVLYSELYHKIYIGYTGDLLNRMKSHNELGTDGYTKNYRPWKVVYVSIFDDKGKAMKHEKMLKGGQGRQFIYAEILPSMQAIGFISA